MPLVIAGATSGSTTIQATDAVTATITLPSATGTLVAAGGALGTPTSGTLTNCVGLPATTGITGTLPVANGGTGTASPSLVAGTGMTVSGSFPNQTVTCTVTGGVTSLNGQTGAITNTDLYAIGSYVTGRPNTSTAYAVNSTLAGSSLYSTSPSAYWNVVNAQWQPSGGTTNITAGVTLVNTGTWRCVSPAQSGGGGLSGLWVRIS